MLNRWTGILCAFLMLGANMALFTRDILPGWLSGDPPGLDELSRAAGSQRRVQTGLYDAEGRNLGRSWTVSLVQGQVLNITSTTVLYPIPLRGGVSLPGVRIDTHLKYRQEDGLLSGMSMMIRGLPEAVVLHGEFYPPDQFACKWQTGGRLEGTFVLDARATRALGDVLRPFDRLPGLYVGRTWRLQLLDPLSQIMPGLQANDILAEAQLVRVRRTETIEHRGQPVEAFVVEARPVRAWVAPDGQVLRQEVELPLLGKLILRDEPFDEAAHFGAKGWPPTVSGGGQSSALP